MSFVRILLSVFLHKKKPRMYFMIVITGNYNFLSYCYKYFKLFCRKLSDRNEGLIQVFFLICNSKV